MMKKGVVEQIIQVCWELRVRLGYDITIRKMDAIWGSGFYELLSKELRTEFPDMKGFSATNLKYCKYFYQLYSQEVAIRPQVGDELYVQFDVSADQFSEVVEYSDTESFVIRQQLADELQDQNIFQIPWGHHVQIIAKCKSVEEALFYVNKTKENGWSRAVLMNFIETGLYLRQGKTLNNFAQILPSIQSDLAKEVLKDSYVFDFLTLTENFKEKELEDALVTNITRLLLELGQGFAYVGRQVPLKIGKKERYIDLLFYHLELRCYIVIELKTGEFEAEYTGKLGLYIAAINHQRKKDTDNQTIGLLICKTKDNIEAIYSLESSSQPIGISEYRLSKCLQRGW